MKLRDIVGNHDYKSITYRTIGPMGEDLFAGDCSYLDGELNSLDGDDYSLDDEIVKFEGDDNHLTVWYESEWLSSDGVNALYVANKLNGNEYGDELKGIDVSYLRKNGLVVVFGYSDDNMELMGAIDDELGCFDGNTFWFTKDGNFNEGPNMIDARWYEDRADDLEKIPWSYETNFPCQTFMIYEDGEPWCRGIVFAISDLK